MIGDNKKSDFKNAKKAGLHAFKLPHKKYLYRNKLAALGNDRQMLERTLNKVFQNAQKNKNLPYTEYAIFYHFFVERLYNLCRLRGIESIFFLLSREGLFLKRLFDSYNIYSSLPSDKEIRTH